MSALLAIDPGPEQSAWLVMGPDGGIRAAAKWDNTELLDTIRGGYLDDGRLVDPPHGGLSPDVGLIVIEQVASYGMPVGAEVFETVYWSGRFAEAAHPLPVERLTRLRVKLALCHDSRARDANVRAALIDRYGGKERAIGRKAAAGPLYGISGDVWSALALAVAWQEAAA